VGEEVALAHGEGYAEPEGDFIFGHYGYPRASVVAGPWESGIESRAALMEDQVRATVQRGSGTATGPRTLESSASS